jgi:lipoprotein-releasing system permease protein
MNFPFFLAKRYLFAKKSRNAINLISTISVFGVAVGTMALIVVLSVFNGFDNLIKSLFNSFYPDIQITLKEGKTFNPATPEFERLKKMKGLLFYSEVLEENALLKYGDKQYIATVKGVDDAYNNVTGIDSMVKEGHYMLMKDSTPYAVVGQGIAYYLSMGLNFNNPIQLYVPKRTATISFNPEEAFNKKYIYPSAVFSIEQDFDSKYLITPIGFARDLLGYSNDVTGIEIRTDPSFDRDKIQEEIIHNIGPRYMVKNRYQQNEMFYKIMKSEKWAIYFILSFILLIASFNVIGSLTMLILDKRKDIFTLQSLGTDLSKLRKIFFLEGWMICIIGAILGLILGAVLCWLQQQYGLIKLHGTGSFIIDYYPVDMHILDFIGVLATVLFIGIIATWYPVRFITHKYLIETRS